jgi:hypothetical protein
VFRGGGGTTGTSGDPWFLVTNTQVHRNGESPLLVQLLRCNSTLVFVVVVPAVVLLVVWF